MSDNDVLERAPLVFISYSHDSPQHKQWVAELATRLRAHGGANVVLDQWDTEPGDDLVKFMENGVRDADRVLMICTTAYTKKANDGQGGVGYEAMVVTGEMVEDLGTTKFVPIIPPENTNAVVPICVSTRRFVDFRHDDKAGEAFDELVRSLHHLTARSRPAIGLADRFQVVEYAGQSTTAETARGSEDVDDPLRFHTQASEIIRRSDYRDWQELIRTTRRICLKKLLEFRQDQEREFSISNTDEAREMVAQAASLYAPLVAIALAGVESGSDRFRNQTSVVSDILNPGGWIRSGRTILVDLPKALAYVYQGLTGAMCVQTRQFDLAVTLARAPLVLESRDEAAPLYSQPDITGWVDSLGRSFTDCAHFLRELPDRWGWLRALFEDTDNFGACISCYYMLLLTTELVALRQANTPLEQDTFRFQVPPVFWFTTSEIARKALQRLLNDAQQVRTLWRDAHVTGEEVAKAWDTYYQRWAGSEVAFRFNIDMTMRVLKNPIRQVL